MILKKYLVILFFLSASFQNFATHIVGGEIFYDCLGGNNYRITLKLYRDCSPGITTPYDNPTTIFIFDSLGTFLDSINISFPGAVVLPYPLTNPCLVPPTNICVQEAVFQTVVNLPPLAGGYNITYQRCCRNSTILNLINPLTVGATYMAHIPDPGLATCNSSPHYNNFPPIFLCAGVPLFFDHSATDPDGDSLHYTLCDPYTGLDQSCPVTGALTPSGCSSIAPSPPAPFVPWLAPYNAGYQMSSSPALAVDPVTGLMTGTPNMIGQWVIGVCVEEYRNGQLLSVNKRDFQFNVVNCGIPVASIPTQQPFCFGSPSNFSQNSINAFTYHWDFGDTTLTNDTSNLFSPSWTYANLGSYTVTLIASRDSICSDTASLNVSVVPLPSMTSESTDTICSGEVLNVPLTSTDSSTFAWVAINNTNTTGESTSAQNGSTINDQIANTSSVVQTVTYSVVPTAVITGCVGSSQSVTVLVNPAPTITNAPSVTICNGTQPTINLSSNLPSTFTWQATDNINVTGESTSIQNSITITDTLNNQTTTSQIVNYTVVATSIANGCVGPVQTVAVDVLAFPFITSSPTASICSGDSISIPLTSNVASTYTWVAVDNPNITGESTGSQSGNPLNNTLINNTNSDQTVLYTIVPTTNPGGCVGEQDTILVTVYHGIDANFDFDKVPCLNQVTFHDSSAVGPVSWLWNFGDGDTSTLENPLHVYDSTLTYDAQLIVSTAHGCKDTAVVEVDLIGSNPVSVTSTTTVCLGNSVQLEAFGGFSYNWSPALGLSDSTIANPIASPTDTTVYTVTIMSVDPFGDSCSHSLTTIVNAVDPDLYSISASADADTIIEGESTILHTFTAPATVPVVWSPSVGLDSIYSDNPTASPDQTTTYVITIFDSIGCPRLDSVTIIVVSEKCDVDAIFVPNTFTPNGDGRNDVLFVRGNQIKKMYFAVYNRRGEKVFETSNSAVGWDGNFQGRMATPDVFAWYLKANCYNGSTVEKKGNVTLIR